MEVAIEGPLLGQTAACSPVLRALPDWFGIEQSVLDYERAIDTLPTWLARDDAGVTAGFVSVLRHFPESAELYVLGVRPELHRRRIGRAMLEVVEEWLRQDGVVYVQVKTRGPSAPDEHYDRTRAFYDALGYSPLEEMPTLWNLENPALIMIKRL